MYSGDVTSTHWMGSYRRKTRGERRSYIMRKRDRYITRQTSSCPSSQQPHPLPLICTKGQRLARLPIQHIWVDKIRPPKSLTQRERRAQGDVERRLAHWVFVSCCAFVPVPSLWISNSPSAHLKSLISGPITHSLLKQANQAEERERDHYKTSQVSSN